MRRFVALHRALDSCPFHRDRATLLAAYLTSSSHEDAGWALYLMSGGTLPRILTTAQLQEWVLEEVALPTWLIEQCRDKVGDTAELVSLLAELIHDEPQKSTSSNSSPSLDTDSLHRWANDHITKFAAMLPSQQRTEIRRWWKALSAPEATFIHQVITQRYQPPVPRRTIEEGIAVAYDLTREQVSERIETLGTDGLAALRAPGGLMTWLSLGLGSGTGTTIEFGFAPAQTATALTVQEPRDHSVSDPASLPKDAGESSEWIACRTRGGPRALLIREGGRAQLWAESTPGQGMECVSARFPELIQSAACLPEGVTLEGELCPPAAALARCQASLTRRLRKLTAATASRLDPVFFQALDLESDSAKDMRTLSGTFRQRQLRDLLPAASPYLRTPETLLFDSWEEARANLASLRSEGLHGLLLLHANDSRRIRWVAPPLTIDAVLLYVETGHSGLNGFNFGVWDEDLLVPLGRVASSPSALDFDQKEELERWARDNEIERFGPVRSVKPELVFEIAFDEVESSPRHRAGFALKSPRIVRWKKGAPASGVSRIEQLRSLSAQSEPHPAKR